MIAITRIAIVVVSVLATMRLAAVARADGSSEQEPDADQKSRAALAAHLARIPRGASGNILPATRDAVSRAFPAHRFYAVRYRDYPMKPPAPLKASNLFTVAATGPVQHLPDLPALKAFFLSHLAPIKDDAQARMALRAWLELAQELYQDGFYEFSIPDDSLAVVTRDGKRTATGKAVVSAGGKGEIVATLTFGPDGKLTTIESSGKVQPGERPS